MALRIDRIGRDGHSLYDKVPSQFLVEAIYRVEVINNGLGGFRLIKEKVERPYPKDYDTNGSTTANWEQQFDLTDWGIFLARAGNQPVGGAAVAVGASVYPMDRFQRDDLAVLWDLRVDPKTRQNGIGAALFRSAADWARNKGYGQLGLETQNMNVPACRFYAKMGCRLGAIHRFGYIGCPEVADEAMLLWYYDL